MYWFVTTHCQQVDLLEPMATLGLSIIAATTLYSLVWTLEQPTLEQPTLEQPTLEPTLEQSTLEQSTLDQPT